MKKSIILLAVVSASLVSCSKTEESRLEVKSGIPMSISASFSDLTKTSTVADGNVLKTTWDAVDTISIVTLDALEKGQVVAIDNFTSSGTAGRSFATFTGTFTGGASPKKVIAIYPALKKDGGKYRTAQHYALNTKGGLRSSILSDIEIGKNVAKMNVEYPFCQEKNDECAHLKDYCLMVGNADVSKIKSGKLSVSLKNLMMVIKVQATFPDDCKNQLLKEVWIGDARNMFIFESSAYVDLDASPFFGSSAQIHRTRYFKMPTSFKIPDSGIVTVYMPCAPLGKLTTECSWIFTTKVGEGENAHYVFFEPLVGNKEVTFEAGKVYRINAKYD